MSIITPITQEAIFSLACEGDIYTDCDGVMMNYNIGYAEYHLRKTGRVLNSDGPTAFDMKDWLGVSSKEEALRLVMEFNHELNGGFQSIPPLPGAADALKAAHAAGRRLHLLSSCSRHSDVVAMRLQNIEDMCGPIFSSITCIDHHESKEDYLSKLPPGYWIEDNYQNALMGSRSGHKTYLVRASHNIRFSHIPHPHPFTWVDSLAQAIGDILK